MIVRLHNGSNIESLTIKCIQIQESWKIWNVFKRISRKIHM